MVKRRFLYHLVDRSPWPFFVSFSLILVLSVFVFCLHFFFYFRFLVLFICFFFFILFFWWRDVVRESTYLGLHTFVVQVGLRIGFLLFIVSEIFFFFAFFWAFFHSSLSPSVWVGYCWPLADMIVFNAYGVPLLNTVILLCSGASVTVVHRALLIGDFWIAFNFFLITLFLAVLFILLQGSEYFGAPFGISDGIYGSVFYMLTGLHGCHVIVGLVFLSVCFFRLLFGHFVISHHLGFEFAAWYWHFVDVVWLFLFVFVYCWGNWVVI